MYTVNRRVGSRPRGMSHTPDRQIVYKSCTDELHDLHLLGQIYSGSVPSTVADVAGEGHTIYQVLYKTYFSGLDM